MKVLVTGGGGFLGQALCRDLQQRGHEVISFTRSYYPELERMQIQQIQGDLASKDDVLAAAQGCEVILHNAAKAGAWGSYQSYYDTNVTGTENVLAACAQHGIRKLVYTSTPSVTHRATHPVAGLGADEVPYGDDLKAPYAATKQIAEKLVLAANSPTLATVALRPRLIWGPGDNQLMPKVAERAHAGRLRLVGDGQNMIDSTFVDNAAQAHMDALAHLEIGSACAGKAYFISNGEPKTMKDTINLLLQAMNAPQVTKTIPFSAAYAVGVVCETLWSVLPLKGEPLMTRFLAEQLATTHWYSMQPARDDFGYVPKVSFEQGLKKLAAASSA